MPLELFSFILSKVQVLIVSSDPHVKKLPGGRALFGGAISTPQIQAEWYRNEYDFPTWNVVVGKYESVWDEGFHFFISSTVKLQIIVIISFVFDEYLVQERFHDLDSVEIRTVIKYFNLKGLSTTTLTIRWRVDWGTQFFISNVAECMSCCYKNVGVQAMNKLKYCLLRTCWMKSRRRRSCLGSGCYVSSVLTKKCCWYEFQVRLQHFEREKRKQLNLKLCREQNINLNSVAKLVLLHRR